ARDSDGHRPDLHQIHNAKLKLHRFMKSLSRGSTFRGGNHIVKHRPIGPQTRKAAKLLDLDLHALPLRNPVKSAAIHLHFWLESITATDEGIDRLFPRHGHSPRTAGRRHRPDRRGRSRFDEWRTEMDAQKQEPCPA